MAEMKPVADHDTVVKLVGDETCWMVKQRMDKLKDTLYESMSVMPFLLPILFDIHGAKTVQELGDLLVVGHLMVGHATSFGKLMDERILPKVFKTVKFSGAYRASNPPFSEAMFNEIDHLVNRPDGPVLLSLKGGWPTLLF